MIGSEAVEQLIEREFDALSPVLQRAARWVRSNGAVLALRSMRSSAKQAGVSPATMTRLAQRLGFEGYEALRAPFVDRLAGGRALPYVRRARAQQRRGREGQLAELCRLQAADVASASALNAPGEIERAAERLLKATRVHFLGLRICHGVAFQLHYVYGLLSANGVLITDLGGTLADQVSQIVEGHVLVAVSHSPYTRATVESVRQARSRGASVLALTDSALSPIARRADQVLLYDTASNSFFLSTTGALALAEALLAAVSARGGQPVLERLLERQQHLREIRAYWEPRRSLAPT